MSSENDVQKIKKDCGGEAENSTENLPFKFIKCEKTKQSLHIAKNGSHLFVAKFLLTVAVKL